MPEGPIRPRMRRSDFQRVTRHGRRTVTEFFLVFILPREDERSARLGITVTRKVGNAVRRNRIKRLIREWFRRRGSELGPLDLVVIAKRDLPERLTQAGVSLDLDRALPSSPCSSG